MSTFPLDHPVRQATWVWPGTYMYQHNHFAQFRWDFDFAKTAGALPLFITADKAYRLYINGQPICRGPARGYQSHWPVDEVDVQPFLRAGHNWISVEGYQPGCSTFQYLHEDYSGLLVTSANAALRDAMKAGTFAMRRSPAHRRQTARYSMQIDFQEHLDLRLDDRSWIHSEAPPQGWSPDQFPPPGQKHHDIPFGRAPYDDVELRGIPLLKESLLAPALPSVIGSGVCGAGYQSVENISWHWVEEGKQIKTWHDAGECNATRSSDWLTLTIPATGPGRFHALVIPAGEFVLGCVGVEVEGAAGGEILDFQHDQFFRDNKAHFVAPGEGCIIALSNRLFLAPGRNAHEFFHPLGFGHMTLIARDLTKPLTVRLRIRTVGYPFTMRGSFDCTDENLNAIHAISRRTQQLCAMDAYVDTPWREQAQWWGDARVQAKNTFYLDGDDRLFARGIRSIAGQDVSGLTPGHAPTCSYHCVLPDFALTWILTLWDHYWQTGSTELFAELHPRAERIFSYFNTPAARHESGLLRHDKRFWLFEDWSTLPKDTLPTFLNLWYLLTLRHVVKLYELIGKTSEAARCAALAKTHQTLIEKYLFDATNKQFHSVLDEQLKPQDKPSVHDHTLAMLLGLHPELHAQWMDRFILPYLRDQALPGAKPSAFWATNVLDLAITHGYATDAVAFIKKHWTPMLATGTTWEDFNWHEEAGGSACHAWTSHPSYHFVNAVTGLSQTSAGWGEVAFSPGQVANISQSHALVPTPRGDVDAQWSRDASGKISVILRLPTSVTALVRSPDGRCEFKLSSNLAPPENIKATITDSDDRKSRTWRFTLV